MNKHTHAVQSYIYLHHTQIFTHPRYILTLNKTSKKEGRNYILVINLHYILI